MQKIFAAVVALALTSGAAAAADAYDKKGASVKDVKIETTAEKSWTGIWLGAFGGYTMTNTELSLDHFSDYGDKHENRGKVDGLGGEGLFGEVQLGVDKQIGRLVVGAYGFLGESNSKTTFSDGDGGRGSVKEKFGWGAAGRAGLLVNNNNLVYLAAGYRQLDTEIEITDSDSLKQTWDGYFGELGLESRLTSISDNAYFRLAGRYTVFDDKKYSWGNDHCWDELKADPGKLEIMGGLLFKVGGDRVNLD